MGKLIIPADKKLEWEGLLPDFKTTVTSWVSALPFDTTMTSGFRPPEKQAALRKIYEAKVVAVEADYKAKKLTKAEYDAQMVVLRGQIANRPMYSAHNWGAGIDIHPVEAARSDANYQTMKDSAGKFGLLRDAVELWHFQDVRFNRSKVKEWLKKAPDWLTSKKGIATGVIVVLALVAALIAIRVNRASQAGKP